MKFVETIRVQSERLEAPVNDLLTLADLERPDTRLDVKDWDLAQGRARSGICRSRI